MILPVNSFAIPSLFLLLSLLPSLSFPQDDQDRSFAARMLYQGLSEDIKRAKPFYRDRSYSSALFHLVRALERSKKLIDQYPTSIEAAEAKPFMDTIRDVIEKMDTACAETDRVRCGYVYAERLRKPEAEEDCAFLARMMAKQSAIDDSLDRGHWGLAIQECKAMEKSISDFNLANSESLVFYPLMVLLEELSDREVEAEGNRQAYDDAYAELNKQKQNLLRGKLTDRIEEAKERLDDQFAPIRICTDRKSRVTGQASRLTSHESRVTPSSPEEMTQKRALIRAKLGGRPAQATPPPIRLPHSPLRTPHSAVSPQSSILNLQSSIKPSQSPSPAPFPTSAQPTAPVANTIHLTAGKTADHADTADQIPLNLRKGPAPAAAALALGPRSAIRLPRSRPPNPQSLSLNPRPSAKSAVAPRRPNRQLAIATHQSPVPVPTAVSLARPTTHDIELVRATIADHADTADQISLNLRRSADPSTPGVVLSPRLACRTAHSAIADPLSLSLNLCTSAKSVDQALPLGPQSPIRNPQSLSVSPLSALRSTQPLSLPAPVGAGIAQALVSRQLATANDLRDAGRTKDALDYYARVLRATTDTQLALKVAQSAAGMILSDHESGQDLESRLQACNDWFSDLKRPSLRPVGRLALAQQLYRQRNLTQAEAQAATLVKDEDEDSPVARQAQMLVALCHLRQGKKEQGLTVLRSLAASDADEELAARAQFLVGWCHMSSQQYAEAASAYHDLTKRFPESKYATEAAKLRERLARFAHR